MAPRKVRGQQGELENMPSSEKFAGYPIEELRLGIIGASELKIDETMEAGDEFEITLRGRYVRTEHSIKTRGQRAGGAQYARERVVVRVSDAMKIVSLGPPDTHDAGNGDKNEGGTE